MSQAAKLQNPIGRFAPSPTGDLHFGSLVAAIASFLEARSQDGKWLVRIEDIDPPREVKGSADRILSDLQRFGMKADEDVLYQSTRLISYRAALRQLQEAEQTFNCSCSRKQLPESGIYPGTCRKTPPDFSRPHSTRINTPDKNIGFIDQIQGSVMENLARERGDFIIWRADDLPAYQLAVVVDDAFQGVTHVVRGADLIESTCRQIFLQAQLGLPTPRYIHLPVATFAGKKLGKRFDSDPVSAGNPVETLSIALAFLGHPPPQIQGLRELWTWAIEHWDIERVPAQKEIPMDEVSGIKA